MKESIKRTAQSILKHFNIGVVSYAELQILREMDANNSDLLNLSKDEISKLLVVGEHSPAQLKQDVFVLHELGYKEHGFFVEFGATNGVDLSNTFLLEKKYNWTGILAEPAKCWHDDLRKNRQCTIDTDCVWAESGTTLTFNETPASELSTIDRFSRSDGHANSRNNGKKYNVNSVSLLDLLDKHQAPRVIDYLSIDTEGSEYEILSNFDFSKYSFRVISCEHNFSKSRRKIFELLSRNGYKRKFVGLSRWDDWYVKL